MQAAVPVYDRLIATPLERSTESMTCTPDRVRMVYGLRRVKDTAENRPRFWQFNSPRCRRSILHSIQEFDMDRLPKPATVEELKERLQDLEGVFAADGWEGVQRSAAERQAIYRFAIGDTSIDEVRQVKQQPAS